MVAAYPGPRWHAAGPEWTGDTLGALDVAKREGFRYIDQNGQFVFRDPHAARNGGSLSGTAFVMHWPDPARNNFRFIIDGKRVRPMTTIELHAAVNDYWTEADVRRWRRGPSGDSERPQSYAAHAGHAAHVGICLVLELKNAAFAHDHVAQQLHATARRVGHRPIFMALWGLPKIKAKCEAFVKAGCEFAVIYGNDPGHRMKHIADRETQLWAYPPTWH